MKPKPLFIAHWGYGFSCLCETRKEAEIKARLTRGKVIRYIPAPEKKGRAKNVS